MAEDGKTAIRTPRSGDRDRPGHRTATTGHEWDGIKELEHAAAALVAVDLLCHDRLCAGLRRPLSGLAAASTAHRGRARLFDAAADVEDEIAVARQAQAGQPRRDRRRCRSRRSPGDRRPRRASPSPAAGPPSWSIASSATAPARPARKGYPNLNDDDWLWGGDARRHLPRPSPRHPLSDHPDTRVLARCRPSARRHADAGADRRRRRIMSCRSPARSMMPRSRRGRGDLRQPSNCASLPRRRRRRQPRRSARRSLTDAICALRPATPTRSSPRSPARSTA